MSEASDQRAKRALLIGIDKYPRIAPLQGCVNDVNLMRTILEENFGFPSENVKLLHDEEASRDRVLAELDGLIDRTGKDDIVVIHYAGHGSQMTDREGDEPDGMDETIMPFDSGREPYPNRDITDDEIYLRLARLGAKTPYTTLIFDSCHSGTITRDTFGTNGRSAPADTRAERDLPPSPIPRDLWPGRHEHGPSGWMPLGKTYVLLAGSRDEETSWEYQSPAEEGGELHGAFTYFLARELLRAGPGTSYRDVFERAAANVTAAKPTQHPQMEGTADREIFGVADLQPMRFVRVTARRGAVVTLAAGAAHGVTAASRWTVYPQATKQTDGAEALGHVEITAVRAVTSDAKIIQEASPGSVVAGCRAVESTHALGDRYAVQLVGARQIEPEVNGLRAALDESSLVALVGEDAPASARIYLLAPRNQARSGDPVPQLGTLLEKTWAVVTTTGELLMPPRPLDAYAEIVANLEKLARYRLALALENPDRDSGLRDKVSLELLRKLGDGRWVVAQPDDAGGQVQYEEGDSIAFMITNHHDLPVFFTLIDLGVTGRIDVLYGGNVALRTGVPFVVGAAPGPGRFVVGLPNEYPFAEPPPGSPVQGTGGVKLFVTETPTDLGFLAQEGVHGADHDTRDGATSLGLLRQTAVGGATRDTLSVGGDDWATVVRTFVIQRSRVAAAATPGAAGFGTGRGV